MVVADREFLGSNAKPSLERRKLIGEAHTYTPAPKTFASKRKTAFLSRTRSSSAATDAIHQQSSNESAASRKTTSEPRDSVLGVLGKLPHFPVNIDNVSISVVQRVLLY